MADPLSVAASIAGLIGLAVQASALVSSIVAQNSNRMKQIVEMGQEITSFYAVLGELQGQLDTSTTTVSSAAGLDLVLGGCMRTLTSVRQILQEIHQSLNGGYFGRVAAHVTFSGKMKNMETYRDLLEKYKATLSVALIVQRRDIIPPSTIRAGLSAVGRPLDTVLQGSDPSDDAQQHMRIYISSAGKALANTLAGGNDLGPSESVSMASTRDEMRFTSFDEWLASFTPRSVEGLETQTLRRAHLRDKRQKLLGQETIYSTALEAPAATVRFHVEKLRKGGMVGEESRLYHSETIDIGRDCLTFELLEQLYQKGYTNVCGFRVLGNPGVYFGPVAGVKAPYAVQVTDGPSTFDPVSGFKINKDQTLIEFYNEYVTARESVYEWMSSKTSVASCKGLRALREGDSIEMWDTRMGIGTPKTAISLERTMRVPEGITNNALPAQLGTFPLFPVSQFQSTLPPEVVRVGGLFIPIFQREALSLSFSGKQGLPRRKRREDNYLEDYAVKIYGGSVNAISGQPAAMQSGAQPVGMQDFVVLPKQNRLDGFHTSPGRVGQFVAMPPGKGYTVEEQVTDQGEIRGLQIEIFPRLKESVRFALPKGQGSDMIPNETSFDERLNLFLTPTAAGLADGQYIFMLNEDQEDCSATDNPAYATTIPNGQLFGAGPLQVGHSQPSWRHVRPTFVRELLAWTSRPSSGCQEVWVEAIGPLTIPVVDRRRHAPEISIQLSPFLNARHLPMGLLKAVRKPQNLYDFHAEVSQLTIEGLRYRNPSVSYTPLFSIPWEQLAIVLSYLPIGSGGKEVMIAGRLGLSSGTKLRQAIFPSRNANMFAWGRGLLVNIHLLDAVTFSRVTGLVQPPLPICFPEYVRSRLPFYSDVESEVEQQIASLGSIKTVEEIDETRRICWDVQISNLSGSDVLGCAFCELNLVNTVQVLGSQCLICITANVFGQTHAM